MTHLILFDGESRDHLLPLSYTRPVADLRVGILTIKEKWQRLLGLPTSFLTQDYLEPIFPLNYGDQNLLINGNLLPDEHLIANFKKLKPGQSFTYSGDLLAVCLDYKSTQALIKGDEFGELEVNQYTASKPMRIQAPGDIFAYNAAGIEADFQLLTKGRVSAPLSATNTLIGPADQLFIEEGASLEAAVLNVKDGPIYIAKDAVVLEGCLLRGPIAIGEGSVLKMGAKIYSGTTLGPQCKVGGEVNNVVFQANSNKGHDGYLGNSVIGQWCNLGADSNSSNLRNDYAEVRVWSYPAQRFAPTGRQFHGLIMGDHSKAGINTMFNTGTVVGVSANIFGEGFPRSFIPSFSWGGNRGFHTYRIDKAIATAERVMARRGRILTAAEKEMFQLIFTASEQYRPR